MYRPISRLQTCIDLTLLSGLLLFISIFLDARLLLMDTIVTGGDTASWYQIAEHLQQTLLPNGRLSGWDMGNFCGYPNFNFYFIPPFLLAVLLSYVGIPLTIALKLVIVSGFYILPVSVYYGLRLMSYQFPAPMLGAFSMLLLLFNESYTMFGGNVLSSLAGEFCYMFAFSLLPYYTGSMIKGFSDDKRRVRNGLLLGLIGLSHLFVFIPAVSLVLFGFFTKKRIAYVIQVCAVGFGVMAFWILPLIAWRKLYTIPVYMIWQSFISWPVTIIAAAVLLVIFLPMMVRKEQSVHPSQVGQWVSVVCMTALIAMFGYALLRTISLEWISLSPGTKTGTILWVVWTLWLSGRVFFTHMGQDACRQWSNIQTEWQGWGWMVSICMVMYFCAHFLQVPDIRFVPPVLLVLLIICFSNYIGHYLCVLPTIVKYSSLIFFLFSILLITILGAVNAPKWYAYNFKGYEQTRGYADLKAITHYLKQTAQPDPLNAPRVGYEKCDRYGPFGGDRVFESLYLFSGRQTLEGIHYSSSIASKFIAFLQTEFSKDIKTPTPYILSHIHPTSAAIHMSMYNISQLILLTRTAKKAFEQSPLFVLEKDMGQFSLYRLKQKTPGYVSPVKYLPVLFTGENWLEQFYQNWFKYPEKSDVYFVPDHYVKHPEDRAVFQDQSDNLTIRSSYLHHPVNGSKTPSIKTQLDHLEISFHTSEIGVPHLIRVSYFPNWKVRGAYGVYPVTPHFMMVIPRSSTVTLTYSRGIWEKMGGCITIFTLISLLFTCVIQRTKASNGIRKRFEMVWIYSINRLYQLEPLVQKIQPVLFICIVSVAIIFGILGAIYRNQPVRTFLKCNELYQTGMRLNVQMDLKKAELTFQKSIDILNDLKERRFQYDHQDVINALLLSARCYEALKKYIKAHEQYDFIISNYPYSRYIAESHVKKSRLYRKYRNYNIQAGIRALEKGDAQTSLKFLNRSFEQTQHSIDQLKKAQISDSQSHWAETAQTDLIVELDILEKIQENINRM
ncbi:MAG: hypothetical protein HQK75_11435 [Candidatus Magnetomorum sp.]|nr:hypothetical protein [Candidatus Magnetomorum sp.]